MAANPLRASIREARRVERELDKLFGRYIGSEAHPRGRVRSAYRQARYAMAAAYTGGNNIQGMLRGLDVVDELRRALVDIARPALNEAAMLGASSATAQLEAYQKAGITVQPAGRQPDQATLINGWRQIMDGQLDRVAALIQSGAEVELILGTDPSLDAARKGALQPAPVQRETAFWLAMAAAGGFTAWLIGRDERRMEDLPFQKQVVAAIDERTTDCCLRAHGQVVPLDKKFHLTGTPRYADNLDWTPFHWYCRSSVALYLPQFDDELTAGMQQAARAELLAREERERVEIHPAHARSKRS